LEECVESFDNVVRLLDANPEFRGEWRVRRNLRFLGVEKTQKFTTYETIGIAKAMLEQNVVGGEKPPIVPNQERKSLTKAMPEKKEKGKKDGSEKKPAKAPAVREPERAIKSVALILDKGGFTEHSSSLLKTLSKIRNQKKPDDTEFLVKTDGTVSVREISSINDVDLAVTRGHPDIVREILIESGLDISSGIESALVPGVLKIIKDGLPDSEKKIFSISDKERQAGKVDPVSVIDGKVATEDQAQKFLSALQAMNFWKLTPSRNLDIVQTLKAGFAKMKKPFPPDTSSLTFSLSPKEISREKKMETPEDFASTLREFKALSEGRESTLVKDQPLGVKEKAKPDNVEPAPLPPPLGETKGTESDNVRPVPNTSSNSLSYRSANKLADLFDSDREKEKTSKALYEASKSKSLVNLVESIKKTNILQPSYQTRDLVDILGLIEERFHDQGKDILRLALIGAALRVALSQKETDYVQSGQKGKYQNLYDKITAYTESVEEGIKSTDSRTQRSAVGLARKIFA
jgi:hypothetical protein